MSINPRNDWYCNNKAKAYASCEKWRKKQETLGLTYMTHVHAKNYTLWRFFIDSFGMNACWHCGYNKCFKAIDFHHLEPGTKTEDKLYKLMCRLPTEERLKELDRVMPLCRNCHAELHAAEKRSASDMWYENFDNCVKEFCT